MFFIGIVTDKNSEKNIKSIIKNKYGEERKFIFLNEENVSNFRNVKFDSIILNDEFSKKHSLEKIIERSKHILVNYDINYKNSDLYKSYSNIITYGYSPDATVTISSATEDDYMIFIQKNLMDISNFDEMQEIRFDKEKSNINAYDGMILTIMDVLYKK